MFFTYTEPTHAVNLTFHSAFDWRSNRLFWLSPQQRGLDTENSSSNNRNQKGRVVFSHQEIYPCLAT